MCNIFCTICGKNFIIFINFEDVVRWWILTRLYLAWGWDGGQMSFLGEVKRAGPGWSAPDRWQRSIGRITNKQRTRRKDRGNWQSSGFWAMSKEGGFDWYTFSLWRDLCFKTNFTTFIFSEESTNSYLFPIVTL